MFSVCKQSHPATGIEFSISCRFFNSLEENIVTAGANILKVFRIVPDADPNTTEKFTGILKHFSKQNAFYFLSEQK